FRYSGRLFSQGINGQTAFSRAPMSDDFDDDDDKRPRVLSNMQVLGFVARRWMRQKTRFWVLTGLFLVSTACEVSIPWAAGGLIDAVSAPERVARAGWIAWAALSAVYLTFFTSRMTAFRIMNRFSSTAMQRLVGDGFARVQLYSADWHASNFAGSTV